MSVCRCLRSGVSLICPGVRKFCVKLGVFTRAWAQNGGLGKMSLCRVIRSAAQNFRMAQVLADFWRTQNVLTVDDFGNSGFSDKI